MVKRKDNNGKMFQYGYFYLLIKRLLLYIILLLTKVKILGFGIDSTM